MPTEQGSPLFAGWRGGRDAAAVAALREAGAVIIGKTVTTEFAAAQARGTRNPWDLTRTPGGSSSGSAAAVGAGMVPAALGTQVVGSAIRPASFCGCFGYKPSVGGINRGGSFDEFSQSCTAVLAASLSETWSVAERFLPALVVTLAIRYFWSSRVSRRKQTTTHRNARNGRYGPRQPTKRGKHCTMRADG